MNNKIYIVGAGGLGKEMRAFLSDNSELHFGGYLDDAKDNGDILGAIERINEPEFSSSQIAIAIGNSNLRREIRSRIIKPNSDFPKLIHSSAVLMQRDRITLGQGAIICAGSILTTDISIGDFCFINLNCTIGHDSVLQPYVSLMPSVNIGGNVQIESGAFIGTGATVLPGIKIGKNAIIGAGALVNKNVPEGVTVKGIPARS